MAASTTDNLTEMAVVMSVLKTNKAVNELQEIFISDGEEFPSKKLKVNILLESSITLNFMLKEGIEWYSWFIAGVLV